MRRRDAFERTLIEYARSRCREVEAALHVAERSGARREAHAVHDDARAAIGEAERGHDR